MIAIEIYRFADDSLSVYFGGQQVASSKGNGSDITGFGRRILQAEISPKQIASAIVATKKES